MTVYVCHRSKQDVSVTLMMEPVVVVATELSNNDCGGSNVATGIFAGRLGDFFFSSHLGTAVVSVRIHARPLNTHYSHHPSTNKPTTTLRSKDRVLVEITEIH